MLKNYLKSAIRSLQKSKLFAAVNILGLSLSMSVCMVALLQIKDAFNYDTFHPFPKRSYRIITDITAENGMKERWATSPLPLAEKLITEYPFIEKTVHVFPPVDEELSYNEKKIHQKISFTESSFFDVFGFTLIKGDKKTALDHPNCIVLSQQAAALFFPGEDPLGKIITFKNKALGFTVTGIIRDAQKKSHLVADIYASVSSLANQYESDINKPSLKNWKDYTGSRTYVLLKENSQESVLNNALSVIAKNNASLFSIKNVKKLHYDYQRLDQISPGENLIMSGDSVSRTSLWIYSGITMVILLMACFNYTNLSLARSLSRVKEIGVRKAIGGTRKQLFFQFIIESVTVSLFALLMAFFILHLLMKLPVIKNRLLIDVGIDTSAIIWFIAFALFTGMLAGALPAAILSSFKSVQVLKNMSSVKIFKGLALRKILVVFQFGISMIFIMFLVTVYKQISFTTSYSYGFNEKNIINISLPESKKESFKYELTRITGVENVSATSGFLGFVASDNFELKKNKEERGIQTDSYFIDENFLSNMSLTLVAGNNFKNSDPPSFKNILLNETAVKNLQFASPDKILGELVWLNDSTPVKVIGVVKDFHYQNLKHALGNLALCYDTGRYHYLNIKVSGVARTTVVSSLQKIWQKTYPGTAFSYSWFDQYLSDARNKKEDVSMVSFLAVMAVTIACLGLLAMVTYTSEIRQKEVSIRKVMGAATISIVLLLSKNFIWLLLIACAVTIPVGYMISNAFLHEFTYRVTVGWQILSTSFLFIMGIGLITITSQTVKIAFINPVKNLRTE
jgi:putative ABC transport system permease protein